MTDNINMETGEVIQSGRSPRFTQWAAFLIFSTITLGASVEEKDRYAAASGDGALANQNWAITCSSITFALSLIAVCLQLHPIGSTLIAGTKTEGVIIVILTAFWAATVSIISDARNGLAVDQESGAVTNGNLYYFSWAGFVCAVMLVVSYLRDMFGVDVAGELQNRAARLTPWSAMLAAQLVVMGSSANIFDQDCAGLQTESDMFCRRTTFGIAVGAIGTSLALVVVGMKISTSTFSFVVELGFSFLLTILNAFGVAYLTAAEGPGSALGNLYYFSWISLVVSGLLLASCFDTYKNGGDAPAASSAGVQNDIQVEELDNI